MAIYKINKEDLEEIVDPNWNILDVGAGHSPFKFTNTILDKYVNDNTQRCGLEIPVGNCKLIEGDIEDMPFSDNEFDFVHTSHVMEHTLEPEKALLELQRVAKAGYIEVPSRMMEYINNQEYHFWYIYTLDNKLIFEEKTEFENKLFQNKRLHDVGINLDKLFFNGKINFFHRIWFRYFWKIFFGDYSSLFRHTYNIQVLWTDTIEYEIIKKDRRGILEKEYDKSYLSNLKDKLLKAVDN
jgi:hypothetical protein